MSPEERCASVLRTLRGSRGGTHSFIKCQLTQGQGPDDAKVTYTKSLAFLSPHASGGHWGSMNGKTPGVIHTGK